MNNILYLLIIYLFRSRHILILYSFFILFLSVLLPTRPILAHSHTFMWFFLFIGQVPKLEHQKKT
jgi:hypothetical protein